MSTVSPPAEPRTLPVWQQEIEEVRLAHGGILRPHDVVQFAENPDTALHARFTWDNSEAAHEYRLWQARHLIRICVTILPHSTELVRVYPSLVQDRVQPMGGYRTMVEVLGSDELRVKLLEQAKREARTWQQKYVTLKELAPIFEAIDAVFEEEAISAIAVG